MNCKPGDLAVIVYSRAGNEGKIVRCLRFIGNVPGWFGDDCWEIDRQIKGTWGDFTNTVQDAHIRPIGNPGDDARDETLEWLPVPSREEVSA